MTISALVKLWRQFWFEPEESTAISIFRILYGLLVLQIVVVHLGSNFVDWYGPNAIVPLPSVIKHFWLNEPRFDLLLLLPQTDSAISAFHITLIVAAFFMTIGFGTRYSTLFVWLSLVSLHHQDPFNINGGDGFLRAVGPWLAFSNCGDKYSLDVWLKNFINRQRGLEPIPQATAKAPWAQRMIQVQLALVYWQTFGCKLAGPQWLDGSAVYYATRLDDMLRFPAPLITNNFLLLKALNYFTLIIEFAGWTLIWFKDTRYWVLAGLLGLHLGIDYMINLPVFEWAFICTLITFVPSKDINYLISKISSRKSTRADQS
ncbi:hypothetical protein BH11CYA1_BH11CYA1_35650 [soil metagenome]